MFERCARQRVRCSALPGMCSARKRPSAGGVAGLCCRRSREWAREFAERLAASVEVADGCAIGDVAFRRRGFEHLPRGLRGLRGSGAKFGREPALDTAAATGFHSVLANHFDSRVPEFSACRFSPRCCRARAVRCAMGGSRPSDMPIIPPIERPQKLARSIFERVEQSEHVAGRAVRSSSRPGRDGRLAVAARVVAQHAEFLFERRQLRIPHGEIRAQGIREHYDWRVCGAGESRSEVYTPSFSMKGMRSIVVCCAAFRFSRMRAISERVR